MCLQAGIGLPGTAEFCGCLQQFSLDVQLFVQPLIAWAKGNITVDKLTSILATYQPQGSVTNPFGYAMDGLVAVMQYIIENAGDYLQLALNAISCALQAASSTTTAGDPGMWIALTLLKWLIGAIKEWEIGTDAIAWIVDRVHLEFGQLEELLDRLLKWAMPVEVPSAGEATKAYLMGQITSDLRDCVWQLNGLNPRMYSQFAMADSEFLTADEIIQIGYRRKLSLADIDTLLLSHGWQQPFDRLARMELHWEIPTVGDHLHWLSRNVDDTDYVQRFGLLDGFSTDDIIRLIPEFSQYATQSDTHGRNFWRTFGDDLTAQGMTIRNAAFHYAAHWIQPSPEQMREFVYRLRPGAPGMQSSFTIDDMQRILAEQDYAPMAIQWFADTVHPVPALSYIVGMYRQNVIDDTRLQAYHMDLGYTETDSNNFVGVDRVFKAQYRASKFAGWTSRAIAQAVALGVLPDADASAKFIALGGTLQEYADAVSAANSNLQKSIITRARSRVLSRTVIEMQKALAVGAIDEGQAVGMLTDLGFPLEIAFRIVKAEEASNVTKFLAEQIKIIRVRFLDGYITDQIARQSLSGIGIISVRIDEYLSLWQLQNGPKRKHRTASQIVADVANGMMDTQTALVRLYNLGYDQADSLLYLADAQRKIIQRDAAASAAADRDARRQAAEQARLAKAAARQAKELQSAAKEAAPRSVLTRWLRRGIITAGEYYQRMIAQGYTPDDATKYQLDAVKEVTESILARWDKSEIIDDGYFQLRLARLGYAREDIDNFQAEITAKRKKPPTP